MRAVALAAIAGVSVLLWMAAHHQLFPVICSYRAMVASEGGSGSMSPTNYEFLAIAGQITSLASLLGYWLRGGLLQVLTIGSLLLVAAGLVVASRRPCLDDGTRLVRICAWSVFGMLATYHRAHDGAFLLLLLPYLLARLRDRHHDLFAWTALAMLVLMGAGPTWEAYESLTTSSAFLEIGPLLLFRQSAIAALVLLILLVIDALRRPQPAGMVVESADRGLAAAA
jgi:hypothetical protein